MDREEKDIIEGVREELAGIRTALEALVAIASAPEEEAEAKPSPSSWTWAWVRCSYRAGPRTASAERGAVPSRTWPASRRSPSPAPAESAQASCRKSERPWAGWD